MSDSSDDVSASSDEVVGAPLDTSGGVPDDSQERNWDGQTRAEYLDMLQASHDDGNVIMDDDRTLVREDAIDEVGVKEVARLRGEMQTYLKRAWNELEQASPKVRRPHRGPEATS